MVEYSDMHQYTSILFAATLNLAVDEHTSPNNQTQMQVFSSLSTHAIERCTMYVLVHITSHKGLLFFSLQSLDALSRLNAS